MCNEGCPQKTDIIDYYLSAFYYCGMKLVDIANAIGVSPDAVEKGLKRFDKIAYAFERDLRKSQNKLKRVEKERVRKQAVREVTSIESKPYYLMARRLINDREILSVFRRAFELQGIQVSDNDQQAMCSRYIPSTGKFIHPVPMEAQAAVELIMPTVVRRTVEYEMRAQKSDLVGVPGPAILNISENLKAGNIEVALQLAKEAILSAGYIPSDASLAEVKNGIIKIIKPSQINAIHELHLKEGLRMAKVADMPSISELKGEDAHRKVKTWLSQARAAERAASDWGRRVQTGKKGKQGGTTNIENRKKISGAGGY